MIENLVRSVHTVILVLMLDCNCSKISSLTISNAILVIMVRYFVSQDMVLYAVALGVVKARLFLSKVNIYSKVDEMLSFL
jgi:hypothetical protein